MSVRVAVVGDVCTVQDTQIILTAPHLGVAEVVNSGYVAATVDVSTAPAFTADRAYRLTLAWDDEQVWE